MQEMRQERSSLVENRGSSEFSYIWQCTLKTKLNSHSPFCTAKTIQHCVKFREIYCTNL